MHKTGDGIDLHLQVSIYYLPGELYCVDGIQSCLVTVISEYQDHHSTAAIIMVDFILFFKYIKRIYFKHFQKQINNSKVTRFTVTVGPNNYYILYNIKVQAFNPMGYGPMSPQVDIMSAEDCECFGCSSVNFLKINTTTKVNSAFICVLYYSIWGLGIFRGYHEQNSIHFLFLFTGSR